MRNARLVNSPRPALAEPEGLPEYPAGDAFAAVALKFHHVLARIAGGCLKIDAQAVVGKRAAVYPAGIEAVGFEVLHRDRSRRDEHFFRDGKRTAAAETNNRHTALAGGRGNRRYVFFGHHSASFESLFSASFFERLI